MGTARPSVAHAYCSAMSATPHLSGSRSVRSCEPPSGKMPMHAPRSSRRSTAPNIALWSGRVATRKGRAEVPRAARRSLVSSVSVSGCAAAVAAAAAAAPSLSCRRPLGEGEGEAECSRSSVWLSTASTRRFCSGAPGAAS